MIKKQNKKFSGYRVFVVKFVQYSVAQLSELQHVCFIGDLKFKSAGYLKKYHPPIHGF